MNKTKTPTVGIRVFAYGSSTSNTIQVYGSGVYTGLADRGDGTFDHRIELDSGGVVWGRDINWVNEVWQRTAVGSRRPVTVPVPRPARVA